MRIVIIGSGNTATVLGRLIKNAGHEVLQIFSRQHQHALQLASELNCEAVSQWQNITQQAEIYVVALSDSALQEIETHWYCNNGMVVHTAGSVSINVLQKVSEHFGVLYPLQSLRKEKMDIGTIPLLTAANTPGNLARLDQFAQSLSAITSHATDEQRMYLHLSAVVVNNFGNHLFTLAEAYCQHTGVPFPLLQPLILETATRISQVSPGQVQTGPAARKDRETIARHLQLLETFPALQEIYKVMTNSILHWPDANLPTKQF